MTDDETTDDEIPDGYEVYHPSWQDPTEGRRGFPIVPYFLVALVGTSLAVVIQALGLEPMFRDMIRALGL